MTTLRLIGVLFGSATLLMVFLRFRSGRLTRFDFLLGSGIATALIVVGAVPASVNVLRGMLSLKDEQFSRLIALSIASNTLLWLLFFQSRVRYSDLHDQLDHLAQVACLNQFQRSYPDIQKLPPVVILIPAFNEAPNIGSVLRGIPDSVAGYPAVILVVDDGSADDTAGVAERAGALVVRSPVNRGGGAALRAGFLIAARLSAEVVVTMDADGQHDPAQIEGLVAPVAAGEYDIVVGSRLLGEREPDSIVRIAGVYFFNSVIRILTTASVTDCSNGFRAMSVAALSKVNLRQDQYHTSELIIEASKKGLRVGEAPVTVRRRLSGESKKGRNWSYGASFAKTILKTWLR